MVYSMLGLRRKCLNGYIGRDEGGRIAPGPLIRELARGMSTSLVSQLSETDDVYTLEEEIHFASAIPRGTSAGMGVCFPHKCFSHRDLNGIDREALSRSVRG